MPVATTYPGVYVEEIPSGVRTITGVATSITAFIGRAERGETNEPATINSFPDFERRFGGLHLDYPLSYAVRDFYINGGSQALIVRLATAAAAQATIQAFRPLLLVQRLAGVWCPPAMWRPSDRGDDRCGGVADDAARRVDRPRPWPICGR